MIVSKLELKNFRNLNIEFDPSNGFNLILGKNGVGKSNLLDALYHLSLVKTFKPYILKNNVNFNKLDHASIAATVLNEDIKKDLKIIFSLTDEDNERKRLEVNSKPTTRSRFVNNLTVILFAPHNTNLLVSSPEVRRNEIDDFGSLVDFKYRLKLYEYKEVLKTRNSLLRALNKGFSNPLELDYWDNKLSDLGGELINLRVKIIDALGPLTREMAKKYFDKVLSDIEIKYLSKFNGDDPKELLREKLLENRDKEIAVGNSLYGPHRDDIEVLHKGKDMKLFGSRGQQRITTLLLKLAMFEYLSEVNNITPVILLDDAMAELDDSNRKKLEEIIASLKCQSFIATTHKSDYSSILLKRMDIISLD